MGPSESDLNEILLNLVGFWLNFSIVLSDFGAIFGT